MRAVVLALTFLFAAPVQAITVGIPGAGHVGMVPGRAGVYSDRVNAGVAPGSGGSVCDKDGYR